MNVSERWIKLKEIVETANKLFNDFMFQDKATGLKDHGTRILQMVDNSQEVENYIQQNWPGFVTHIINEDGRSELYRPLSEEYLEGKVTDRLFSSMDLIDIVIPESVEVIGQESFKYQTNLKNVTIHGAGVTIENKAFHGCGSLEYVKFTSSVPPILVGKPFNRMVVFKVRPEAENDFRNSIDDQNVDIQVYE